MFKYLRIAVTALSLMAFVLLVALWVRSYWWKDRFALSLRADSVLDCSSASGQLWAYWGDTVFDFGPPGQWYVEKTQLDDFVLLNDMSVQNWGLTIGRDDDGLTIGMPYWCVVALCAATAAIPWLPWSHRFSLRTLLIATTLVAVGLAAIVYASR